MYIIFGSGVVGMHRLVSIKLINEQLWN